MIKGIISITYMLLSIVQLIINRVICRNNRPKREELRLLEFQQKILNMNIYGEWALSKDVHK